MRRENRFTWVKASIAGACLLSGALVVGHLLVRPTSVRAWVNPVEAATSADSSADSTVYLNQGWSPAVREAYYHISQGSAAMSYDIFLNLEVANGQELFRSDANSEHYGLIPDAANPATNPDGLPIGIAKEIPQGPWKGEGEQVGFACAACHESEIHYKGKKLRIEGGSGNHFDLLAYIYALDDASQATLTDQAKFDRLAARLGASSSEAKSELRKRFEPQAARLHEYRTRTLVTPSPWGPGRLDAIALIVNRMTSIQPRIPENWSTPLAPTKPPFLWNSPQGSWTQWRATQQDPIRRNMVETMGVFMPLDLAAKNPQEGLFDSNSKIHNLVEIEDWLDHLAPPHWPEEVLGKIDHKKAADGKVLFEANCTRCHNSYPYTWTEANKYGKRFIEVGVIPQKYVGTDPGQFDDLRPYAITGQLSPYLPSELRDKDLVPTGALYVGLQEEVVAKAIGKVQMTDAEEVKLHGDREFPLPRPSEVPSYKAAPRDGVWATGPYLHNGSVPNLYEMLIPAKERTTKFYIGSEFDPVRVGVDTTGASGKFLMDTTLRGNSNAGHSFENAPLGNGVIGPLLTEEQRWAIVEYLKSIPEKEGQVTPFGGTPDAPKGHGDWAKQ